MIMFMRYCLLQLRSPGQAGVRGQAAQRAVAVEGQTDIVPVQARNVLEIRVRQNGATPTHAQVFS